MRPSLPTGCQERREPAPAGAACFVGEPLKPLTDASSLPPTDSRRLFPPLPTNCPPARSIRYSTTESARGVVVQPVGARGLIISRLATGAAQRLCTTAAATAPPPPRSLTAARRRCCSRIIRPLGACGSALGSAGGTAASRVPHASHSSAPAPACLCLLRPMPACGTRREVASATRQPAARLPTPSQRRNVSGAARGPTSLSLLPPPSSFPGALQPPTPLATPPAYAAPRRRQAGLVSTRHNAAGAAAHPH